MAVIKLGRHLARQRQLHRELHRLRQQIRIIPFSKRIQKFDLTGLLSECHDNNNRTGLMCGKECLRFDSWCQQIPIGLNPIKCVFSGHEPFLSDDKDVCSHPTFWRDKECTEHRCTGFFPGQCRHTVSVLGMMY